jgi:hypothetical protein
VPRLSLEGRLVEFALVHYVHARRPGSAVHIEFWGSPAR